MGSTMEIRTVEAVPLRRELGRRFANAQKWIDAREYCLVRVETADGAVGWGECWGPIAGNREVIEERVADLLRGRDPQGVESVHDDLLFDLRSAYHSRVPAGVVSGVDLALWDIRGKVVDQQVYNLFGGRATDEIPCYVTTHVDVMEHMADERFFGVKLTAP
jgi:D-galactarolactone cycloisomerase